MTPEELADRSAQQQAKKPLSLNERLNAPLPEIGDTREQSPQPKTAEDRTAETLAKELPDLHPNGQKPEVTEEIPAIDDVELTAEDFGPTDPEAPALPPEEQEAKALQTEQVALQQEQATITQYAQALAMRQQEIQRMVTSGAYDENTALAMHEQMQQEQAALNQAAMQFQQKANQYASKHNTRFMNDLIKHIPEWADTKLMEEHRTYLSDWLAREKRMTTEQMNALSPAEIASHHKAMMEGARQRKAKRLKTIKKVPMAKDSEFYRDMKATADHNKRGRGPVPLEKQTDDFASKVKAAKKHADEEGMSPWQRKAYLRDLMSSRRL